jgi:protein-tyrosine-phosphatase
MAEAFARAYGSDVIIPASAGLMPAHDIAADTLRAMDEKGLDIRAHFPKSLAYLGRSTFELVINMSGFHLPEDTTGEIEEWDVPDPICLEYDDHCEVRNLIERRVMQLILRLRAEQKSPQPFGGPGRAAL